MARSLRLFAVLFVLLCLFARAALADEPSPSSGPFESMGLTAEQTGKLRQIHSQFSRQKRALHQQIDRLRQELSERMGVDTPDPAAIKQSLRDIVLLEERHQELLVDEFVQVLGVLTPDQKRLFRERMIHRILHDRKDRS